jgi:hypothetical protein
VISIVSSPRGREAYPGSGGSVLFGLETYREVVVNHSLHLVVHLLAREQEANYIGTDQHLVAILVHPGELGGLAIFGERFEIRHVA